MKIEYSIITATKNSARTLNRTLDSVNKQIFKPKFHLFVDKDSNDQTLEIIENYKKKKNTKVILLNQKKSGIYNAWNEGLIYILSKVSDSHYFCILNSDDWLVENYIDLLNKYNGEELIAGACIAHYQNKKIVRKCRTLNMFPFYMPIIDPSLLIRASLYRKIGLYREKFKVAGDYDFSYRAFKNGYSPKVVEEILVNVEMGGFASQNLVFSKSQS